MSSDTPSPTSIQAALRQLQLRHQRLIELSSDWYWEQDTQHRFTSITGPDNNAQLDAQMYIGKTLWEIIPYAPHDDTGWSTFQARLHAREPFANFLTQFILTPTERHYISLSGRPMFDESGAFSGYCGISKNVTTAQRDEHLARLEHAVTRQLAAADNAERGMLAVMRLIGEAEQWDCVCYWHDDPSGDLLTQPLIWYRPGLATATIDYFAQQLTSRLATALVLPVNGYQSAIPGDSKNTASYAWLTLPVVAAEHSIGILQCASTTFRSRDAALSQTVEAISSQIAQFLQRQQAEHAIRASEARFRSLIEFSSDWYWEQDEQFCFIDVAGKDLDTNRNFIGKPHWHPSFHTEPVGISWQQHRARLAAREAFHDLILKKTLRDGALIYYSLSGRPLFDTKGDFKGYRGIGKDVTHQRHAEERIRYLANHDSLTTLPNRAMFGELLNRAINYARRYNHHFAVMFIDLDRFKTINDTLGHDAGDQLLQTVAHRLTTTLRASDVVARLGGDEFVLLVQEIDTPAQAALVARKILLAVIKPLTINGQECRVTASVGICLFPDDAQDEQTLMKNADIAMYQAKEAGKNNYQFYSASAKQQSLERLAMEANLRHALERGEFQLHYQAKLDLRTDRITGVEALLRWQQPDLGAISPAQFIPLAEETGLIVPIGRWVIKTACLQNMAWQRQGLPPVCMAVNLSARQFADDNLLADITDALQQSGLPGDLLELELTESMVMQDYQRTIQTLTAIKAMNVRIAIDDFGVGYSSLAQIKHFPIDTLKVDRSFIRDLPQNSEDSAITKAIIAMGKTLSLRVVAEGVETIEQEDFLRANACDETQGFYFSRPIAADKFAELLQQHIAAPRTDE